LDLRAPENFWQGLGGSLQGSGRVEGQLPVPLLRGELQGTALSLVQGGARYRLEALQLAAEVVGNDANTVTLDLTGLQAEQEGSAGQTWLESATLELRGNPASHSLQVSARGFDSELRLALEGEQAGTDWQGTLQLADVDSPWGHLQLEQAVPLQYGASGFSVPQHCWTLAPLSLCAQAASAASGAVDADLSL